MIRELTSTDFEIKTGDYYIKKANNTGALLLVKTEWCGHCKNVKPILEDVAKKLGKAYPIFKLDADSNSDLVKKLKVQGFPTIFYVDRTGKISKTYEGERTSGSFLEGICKNSLVCKK